MGRIRWLVPVLALLAAGWGCGKKGPAQATASTEGKRFLPPGAAAYVEVDVKAALASPIIAPYKASLWARLPPACQPMAEAIERLSLAVYGGPEGMLALLMPRKAPATGNAGPAGSEAVQPMPDLAALITGPTKATVRACLEDAARAGEGAIREENRGGQAVLIGGKAGRELALVSPDDTTHVFTVLPRLDAVLATVAGGPSIDGTPLLAGLTAVPAGTIVLTMTFPESLAPLMTQGLEALAGGQPIPPPRMIAASLTFGDTIVAVGAMTMADEASAESMERIARTALDAAKAVFAMMGKSPEMAPAKQVLDGITISRSGLAVSGRASMSASFLQNMFLGDEARPDAQPRK